MTTVRIAMSTMAREWSETVGPRTPRLRRDDAWECDDRSFMARIQGINEHFWLMHSSSHTSSIHSGRYRNCDEWPW